MFYYLSFFLSKCSPNDLPLLVRLNKDYSILFTVHKQHKNLRSDRPNDGAIWRLRVADLELVAGIPVPGSYLDRGLTGIFHN